MSSLAAELEADLDLSEEEDVRSVESEQEKEDNNAMQLDQAAQEKQSAGQHLESIHEVAKFLKDPQTQHVLEVYIQTRKKKNKREIILIWFSESTFTDRKIAVRTKSKRHQQKMTKNTN